MCHITLNKTAIFGDNGTISPGGVRIGKLTDLFHISHILIYYYIASLPELEGF